MFPRFLAFLAGLLVSFFTLSARADKVVVLPFSAPKGAAKTELDQARVWTNAAVVSRGHTIPNASETASAELAVVDGSPDTSSEYRAAGQASGSQWTVTGRLERSDVASTTLADGSEEGGYTLYRVELEACQVESGRVESLVREIDPDEAPVEIGEMLALLLRPEGVADAPLPWASAPRKKKRAKPAPAPETAPPPPVSPPEPAAPARRYAEGHPLALGLFVGVSNALSRPDVARGPSWAMPVGGVLGYAIESVPGLELRGLVAAQAVGPRSLEVSAGARYAIAVLPRHRVYVGPELLLGAHVALGAAQTARALGHGSAFLAWGVSEHVQLEIAGDLSAALGGTGTLLLGGGSLRGLYRF